MARRGRRDRPALRRRAAHHAAVRGLHPLPPLGLRRDARRALPAAAALPLLPAVLKPGRQAGRPRLRAVHLRRLLQRRAARARLRLLRGASPCATRRCRRACRRSSRREVGHLDLAYDYLTETAFIDLRDLAVNTKDGVHLAALAGCWQVAVAGFGGMRDHGSTLRVRAAPARRACSACASGCCYRDRRAARDRRPRGGALRAAQRRAAGDRPPRRASSCSRGRATCRRGRSRPCRHARGPRSRPVASRRWATRAADECAHASRPTAPLPCIVSVTSRAPGSRTCRSASSNRRTRSA